MKWDDRGLNMNFIKVSSHTCEKEKPSLRYNKTDLLHFTHRLQYGHAKYLPFS